MAQTDTVEPREHRIKRLYMRSIRRGIKEMDILLMAYADRYLADMTDAQLALYDQLLLENDQDLYQWVTGQAPAPEHLAELVAHVAQTNQ
ncbi:succinate dehydrogenase assembly factor 2 [Phaeobacter sp.]|uniref:succinate dehydrogenase assembly factor 2 n=1 Tax=Phaeobacter sp. TaxID=1902409 RepID=UPI0025D22B8B|nr:succinate dehydrogenase assembly factor 2 [Phaeobacter sp.]